jgi:hypothetical protein
VQAAGSLGLTRGAGGAGGGNPFFRLLRAYLQHFLPRPSFGALAPPRPGSEQQALGVQSCHHMAALRWMALQSMAVSLNASIIASEFHGRCTADALGAQT